MPETVVGPFPEDDGAIPLASPTGLVSGARVRVSGVVGDGPHGSAGANTGDFDFFAVTGLSPEQRIFVDVDTALPFGDLDPVGVPETSLSPLSPRTRRSSYFLSSFHTFQFNAANQIMDQGGNAAGTFGLGPDLIFGSADDEDVDFGVDFYAPNEGFTGVEDTLNATAFGMSTGRREGGN